MMHAPGIHCCLDYHLSQISSDCRKRMAFRGAMCVPHTPPSPLAREGWGGGWLQTPHMLSPLSLSLPRQGGGNVVALTFASLHLSPRLSARRGSRAPHRCTP